MSREEINEFLHEYSVNVARGRCPVDSAIEYIMYDVLDTESGRELATQLIENYRRVRRGASGLYQGHRNRMGMTHV